MASPISRQKLQRVLAPDTRAPFKGPLSEKGSYKIAASFCSPKKKTSKAKNVIIATHGIGPARAHWNSPFKPEDYNFVQHATAQGYPIFFYDRLGCGASQKQDPILASVVCRVLTSLKNHAIQIVHFHSHRCTPKPRGSCEEWEVYRLNW